MAKKGDSANGSGDVNFTAACMSVGIPLNQSRAALAVKCETGRDYCRFFLEPVSIDGAIKLDWCNAAWRARKAETGPMAGFGWLMEFIAAKPAGVRTTADWLAHAHDHLRECGIRASWTWPRQVEQINALRASADDVPQEAADGMIPGPTPSEPDADGTPVAEAPKTPRDPEELISKGLDPQLETAVVLRQGQALGRSTASAADPAKPAQRPAGPATRRSVPSDRAACSATSRTSSSAVVNVALV